jgi:hypothetical protein
MILSIVKGEATGFFGGVRFTLSAKVELTSEESGLIQRFKLEREPILVRSSKSIFSKEMVDSPILIGDFVRGISFKCKNVDEILQREVATRESCRAFKNYLLALTEFDQTIVEEY